MKLTDLQSMPQGLIGKQLIHVPSIDSTMDLAREEASKGAVEGTTVVTTDQFGGRGRKGRTWLNSAGDDLAISFVLYPSANVVEKLFLVCSLGVADCVREITDGNVKLKWPNDIYINGSKLAGVLVESSQTEQGFTAVVGVGLNVNMPSSHPAFRDHNATSLREVVGTKLELSSVLQQLLSNLDKRYAQAIDKVAPLESEWERQLLDIGLPIRAVLADGRTYVGIAEGVDKNGRLMVRDAYGETALLTSDDVVVM